MGKVRSTEALHYGSEGNRHRWSQEEQFGISADLTCFLKSASRPSVPGGDS